MRLAPTLGTLLTCALLALGGSLEAADDSQPADGLVAAGSPEAEFFETEVRPVLANHCFECHGPEKQKAGLRLDARDRVIAGGDSGAVVVPGKPEESLLVDAIHYGPLLQMPPTGKLTDQQIAALTKWVALGVPWPKSASAASKGPTDTAPPQAVVTEQDRRFWSFQPIGKPAPPAVDASQSFVGAIDRFLAARRAEKGLVPVPPADKSALIRRASYDLTGFPPTPEEVEAFLADESPDAFAKVVDRLLASPHYGERWGRYWLDIARYGEDQAHDFQPRLYPSGYRYRDWVAKALNRDLPYDRFVKLQIAGDLFDGPEPAADRMAALGFFACGPVYYNDGIKSILDGLDDRVDTLSRGFLGLTVACARCHDHKFDPIPTKDYYALAGIFHSTDYREYPLAPKEEVDRYEKAQKAIKAKENEIDAFNARERTALTEGLASKTAEYVVAAWRAINKRKTDSDYSLEDAAKAAGLEQFALRAWVGALTAEPDAEKKPHLTRLHRLVASQDAKVDAAENEAALTEVQQAAQALEDYVQSALRLRRALEEHEQALLANTPASQKETVEKPKLDSATELVLNDIVSQQGLFRIPRREFKRLLSHEAKQQLAELEKELKSLKDEAPEKYEIVHALTEGKKIEDLNIRIRGVPTNEGPPAPRGFLTVLSEDGKAAFNTKGSGRFELAGAIASPQNPLTARVIVNRIWQHHFGRGLVDTPSNFGQLGSRPSHPELLDYLASRFIELGWSMKALHREIMLSATYQLSSQYSADNFRIDPENVYLWRAPRRRLDIEAWRDTLLAVAGNLDRTVGGPSLKLDSPDNNRRTFYAFISRHRLNTMLRLFDFPDPNITAAKRAETMAPLQQLFVMNSEFMVREARALVARLDAEAGSNDAERIRRAFRVLYSRPVTDAELQLGLDFLTSAREEVADSPATVAEVSSAGAGLVQAGSETGEENNKTSADKNAEEETVTPLSPWEQYAQVLLAASELMFVD